MLQINNISLSFEVSSGFLKRRRNYVHALRNVSLEIPEGSTFAVAGESGSGKSTLARVLTGLYRPDKGSFAWQNYHSDEMTAKDLRRFRRNIAMVFQDPYSSLNPRLKIRSILKEPLSIHRRSLQLSRADMNKKAADALDAVGLPSTALEKYPHEFSGGQRQRIGIARALILNPAIIILDEPVSALDVSIQAQILNLLTDLKKEFNLTYIFIAHDLSVVEYISDMTAIMYLGMIMEVNKTTSLFKRPRHPYTASLIESMPDVDSIGRDFNPVEGEIPSPMTPPAGCPFVTRCSRAESDCNNVIPPVEHKGSGLFRCFYPLK